jgi:uncharacterized membrane protein
MINLIYIAIIIFLLDCIYLSFILPFFYEMMIKIQGEPVKVRYTAVILCYILLIFSYYYFIDKDKKSTFDSFLLGFFIYGIYDLTNYATIKKWDYRLVILDTIWGGTLFTLTNVILKNLNF